MLKYIHKSVCFVQGLKGEKGEIFLPNLDTITGAKVRGNLSVLRLREIIDCIRMKQTCVILFVSESLLIEGKNDFLHS